MFKLVKRVAVFVVSSYVLIAGLAYAFQEHLMFHFAPVAKNYQYHFDSPYEDVWLKKDDADLHGILLRANSAKRADEMVIYYKGNMGNVGDSETLAKLFLGLGYDVLTMDYRGFGKSVGPMSEDLLLADAEGWFDWAAGNYGAARVRLVGYSFGNIILFAPMKSILDMAARRYPFLPDFLTSYPLRSDLELKKAPGHILIYHGTADDVVPIESGAALAEELGPDDAFMRVKGANHYTVALQAVVQADIIRRWTITTATLTEVLPRAVASLSTENALPN